MKKFRLYFEEQNRGPLTQLWQQFQRQHAAVLGLVMFSFFLLLTIFAPLLTPHNPYLQNPDLLLLAPSWSDQGDHSGLFVELASRNAMQ